MFQMGMICSQIYKNVHVFHSKWWKEEKYKRGNAPNAKHNSIYKTMCSL